jgi:hypothetical protein
MIKKYSKFLRTGILNYLVGNLIFALLWTSTSKYLSYFYIAVLTILIASIFSFVMHHFLSLGNSVPLRNRISNVRIYVLFQITIFVLGLYLVPFISQESGLNIIFVQLIWSGAGSLISLFLVLR